MSRLLPLLLAAVAAVTVLAEPDDLRMDLQIKVIPGADDDVTEEPVETEPTCAATSCPLGSVCRLKNVQCIREPCFRQPKCVGPDEVDDLTCANIRCAGVPCKMVQVQCVRAPCPLTPTCVQSEDATCDTVKCSADHECKIIQPQCLVAPCPKIATCAPINNSTEGPEPTSTCKNVKCTSGSHCVMERFDCVPGEPCTIAPRCIKDGEERFESEMACHVIKCSAGLECQRVYPKCDEKPDDCNKEVGMCIAPNQPILTCATVKCKADHECKIIQPQCLVAPCPPIVTCLPVNNTAPVLTCSTFDCQPGYVCKMEQVMCIREPCPPRPHCVKVDNGNVTDPDITCDNVDCLDGFVCRMIQKQCQPKPCKPKAICVDITEQESPCNLMDCRDGLVCIEESVVCKKAPCPPRKGRCVPANETAPPLTCANMLCPIGKVCKMEQIMCIRAPCPPGMPRCVPVDGGSTDAPIVGTCGTGETFDTCFNGCENTCDQPHKACTEECKIGGGCRCSAGLLRASRGVCVPAAECPNNSSKCEGKNEEHHECKPCPRVCGEEEKPCAKICKPGCDCAKGFIRNREGVCIPESECPSNATCSGKNEEHSACVECNQICGMPPLVCNTLMCRPGCQCQKGFIRNKEKVCIPESECKANTSCTKENEEHYDCVPCPQECGKEIRMCKMMCQPGCYCKKGFIPNEKGACIPESECPSNATCSGKNEEFNECGSACPQICGKEQPIVCPAVCKMGCQCMKGFIRSEAGECIPEAECKPSNGTCTNENEQHYQCKPCPQVCGEEPKLCTMDCRPGCECKKDFIRNEKGACIPESECPSNATCSGKNEEYSECSSACPEICGKELKIACPAVCRKGCQCQKGFIRSEAGECIPEAECKPYNGTCTIENEQHYECKPCAQVCGEEPKVCTKECRPGCECKVGFFRSEKRACIPESECPSNVTCSGKNEEYSECKSCPQVCGKEQPMCPAVCVKGCQCLKGFIRSEAGECIPEAECKPSNGTCINENEEQYECKPCVQVCGQEPKACTMDCRPGCECKKGFIRNENGTCIPEAECTKCTGENEEHHECRPCPRVCGEPPKACTKECRPGCGCKTGFIKNSKRICIPESECPDKPEEKV